MYLIRHERGYLPTTSAQVNSQLILNIDHQINENRRLNKDEHVFTLIHQNTLTSLQPKTLLNILLKSLKSTKQLLVS